ncbi:hypothetical protein GR131_14555 [Streptomyces sp. GF20]|uniref:hypothetical protein n=1 Tax=Streptomyces sp. GF20 TaxID=2692235 RepID=UPI0013188919|nr:hypothetical protein [Streptomyces sp. GF20]QHC16580.1 hypothetical protein GR131_14555 [Streptomyces sp. GF20]
MAESRRKGWNEGYEAGRESGASSSKSRIAHLEKRVEELEEQLDAERRVYEVDGFQVVQVGKYTYRWRGSDLLRVGDRVLLPENWLSKVKEGPGHTVGVVTRLGTTYRGSLTDILGRAPATDGSD